MRSKPVIGVIGGVAGIAIFLVGASNSAFFNASSQSLESVDPELKRQMELQALKLISMCAENPSLSACPGEMERLGYTCEQFALDACSDSRYSAWRR